MTLAIREFISMHQIILENIHRTTVKMSSLKNAAILRQKSNLVPVFRNQPYTYKMIERYIEIQPALNEADFEKNLEKLEAKNKSLQKSHSTMAEVRTLFDY